MLFIVELDAKDCENGCRQLNFGVEEIEQISAASWQGQHPTKPRQRSSPGGAPHGPANGVLNHPVTPQVRVLLQ